MERLRSDCGDEVRRNVMGYVARIFCSVLVCFFSLAPLFSQINSPLDYSSCYLWLDGQDVDGDGTSNGEPLADTYITMLNGKVNFTLPGYAKYKITIDKGCFYCYEQSNRV